MKFNLSETLRLRRLELGYTQQFMATRLGVTQQSYSKIENNPENTTLKLLLRVSEILQLEPRMLYSNNLKEKKSVQQQLEEIKYELKALRKNKL